MLVRAVVTGHHIKTERALRKDVAHDDRVISLALAAHRLVTTSAKPKVDRKKLASAMAETSAALWKPSGGLLGY